MAKFHKVQAISRNIQDEEQRDLLGLENLPVETGISEVYVDFDRIESFAPGDDNENDSVEIIMYSGLHSTLSMSIEEFLKLMNG